MKGIGDFAESNKTTYFPVGHMRDSEVSSLDDGKLRVIKSKPIKGIGTHSWWRPSNFGDCGVKSKGGKIDQKS